jgi:UDP-perosamine 4-acetyltransferase
MKEMAIYGAGGLGRLALDILLQAGRYRPVGFLDSDPRKWTRPVDGLPVWGGLEAFERLRRRGVRGVLVAVGDNHDRVAIAEHLRQAGAVLVSAVHPLASISPTATLGEHLLIGARVMVCVHARIGSHAVLMAGAIVEHENTIGRGAFLHPAVRLAGTVSIGDFATVGIGACVIPGRRIGPEARIEPGAIVIADVEQAGVVTGAPARAFETAASHFVPG